MTSRLDEARTIVRELSAKALAIVDDPRVDNRRKKAALDRLEPQIDAANAEVQSWIEVAEKRGAFLRATQPGSMDTYPPTGAGGFGMGPRIGTAPSLTPTEDQLRGLHDAMLSHKSFRLEVGTKDSVSSQLPAQLAPGIVPFGHEPTRLADLLPSTAMTAPSIEYLRHVSTTGAAGMTAPGALKPAVTLNVDKVEARARKIAVVTTVNDEDLEDFSAFTQYITTELQRLVVDTENAQLLAGDGVGENLLGLLNQTGILVRSKGAAPETGLDTLELAATDLRTGPAFVGATVYVLNPLTWSALRRTKDGQGRYLLGAPDAADAATLWGTPVITSTSFAAGIVGVLNGPAAASVHWRSGLVVQTDYGTTGFERNQTAFRCEARLALAVPRPAAIVKVTGL